jgi:hypothetical protein
MTRLFRVTSRVKGFSYKNRVYDSVEICWFVVYRETPSIPYEQILRDCCDQLNSHYVSENNIKELFTEEEANALKRYILRVHKEECEVKRADPLLEIYTLGYGDIVPGEGEGFYRLNEEDGYDLPFVVWGYYDVGSSRDVSWLTYGMEFVERVLDKIGLSVKDKDRLREAIEDLKDEGLFVEKGITSKDRLKSGSLRRAK